MLAKGRFVTLTLSSNQFEGLSDQPVRAWAQQMVERLLACDPTADQALNGISLLQRCINMAVQAQALDIADAASLWRLGEMVHAVQPGMQLQDLPPAWQEVLHDLRFSAEDRVDILTLRLAFKVPR